jgi:hypothetical protein
MFIIVYIVIIYFLQLFQYLIRTKRDLVWQAREFLQKMIDDADSELLLVHTANNSRVDIISNNNSEKNEDKQTSNSNL